MQTYLELLEAELRNCESLIDIGCGASSPISRLKRRIPHTVGVDLHEATVAASRAAGIHDEYLVMDVVDAVQVLPEKSYDCVLALDLLEHLPRDRGLTLLSGMERLAKHKVLVFTPNGHLEQHEYGDNPLQEHRSGWTIAELEALGYRVRGLNGLKWLNRERGLPRWRPRRFWMKVNNWTIPLVEHWRELAFQLLAVKDVDACPSRTTA